MECKPPEEYADEEKRRAILDDAANRVRIANIKDVKDKAKVMWLTKYYHIGPFTFNADTLERVDFPGGYFDSNGKAHFMLTDRLGNVNMVVDCNRKIVQRNTYYPYGEPHREPSGQRYLFAGKERQDFVAAGCYDFHARLYDPALILWRSPDRHAADYADTSPYVYCAANPIKYIAPSGMALTVAASGRMYEWVNHNNSWVFMDYENNIYSGGSAFIDALSSALNDLMIGGPTGKSLVQTLVDDERAVKIYNSQEQKKVSSYAEPKTNSIIWDMNGTEIPIENGYSVEPFIDLAHEMGHILFYWVGLKNAPIGYLLTSTGWKDFNNSEVYATHLENIIRAENKKPLRVAYSRSPEGEDLFQLIQKGTRKSVYYKSSGNTDFVELNEQLPFIY